jgi:hypothetical protein
MSEKPASE